MSNYHIETLIKEEDLKKRVKELAKQISEDYKNKDVRIIGIMKGAFIFMSDLVREIDLPNITIDFMNLSSYGDDISSSGHVRILKDLDKSIDGKNIIIVEDIIDTGVSMKYLVNLLNSRKPESIEICTLLNKTSKRIKDVDIKYYGFDMKDVFVVGYGLDYKELHRSLPYIGEVVFDE